ncbi:usherin-like [Tubulanus polymorphus]|uniref:usherin-like n=1 Tax=Tubulanus polymorphus TaxID=672921 RepID=UPI003DA336D1
MAAIRFIIGSLFVISDIFLAEVIAQGNFPRIFNVELWKPITTTPVQSTCGIPTRTTFCQSAADVTATTKNCPGDEFCIQDCPVRTNFPPFSSLLSDSSLPTCAIRDTINLRPNSIQGAYSIHFQPAPSGNKVCSLSPTSAVSLGANAAFTMSLWFQLDNSAAGTLIEKTLSVSGGLIFRVVVNTTTVTFFYRSSQGEKSALLTETITPNTWHYLAIQVYSTSCSFFFNGLRPGFAATQTITLPLPIFDGQGTVKVANNAQGNGQFFGRLQDFKFYSYTLTNREIGELYSGVFPSVPLQSNCRCPATHPRVRPQSSRYCIRNGVPNDKTADEVVRLNNYSHPLGYLNDGDSSTFWVSSDLNEVTLTVDLLDQFQIFYVVLTFYSPMSQSIIIERMKDSASPWTRWQLYATDCKKEFNVANNGQLNTPNAVNCIQIGSQYVPALMNQGNVTFNLLSQYPGERPGYMDFYNTPQLKDFVLAEKVRVTLKGHLSQLYLYYGLFQYIIIGRCQCNGYAKSCDLSALPYKCQCDPLSNTEGSRCDRCKPLFNDKPFKSGMQDKAFNCKPCRCHNHASSCRYDASLDSAPNNHDAGGGGVCINCQHNTTGRLCDVCVRLYYRDYGKSLELQNVCTLCNCFAPGVNGSDLDCEKIGGQCRCKENVDQRQCDKCRNGFYNLQASKPLGCDACGCHAPGTINGDISCHATSGQCNCKANVRDRQCSRCQYEYYNLTEINPDGCSPCECNPSGSMNRNCDPSNGKCFCKDRITGRQCDQCKDGFYNFANGCLPCGCDTSGSVDNVCDKKTGMCRCKINVEGLKCDRCKDTFYNLKATNQNGCDACGCNINGTMNSSLVCDKMNGSCSCMQNVQGRTCNQCKGNTWGLGMNSTVGCSPCDCDPSGTFQGDQVAPYQLACDQNNGQCACLSNRINRRCDSCAVNHYVLNQPGQGCQPCNCGRTGGSYINVPCDPKTGQCSCIAGSGLTGRTCDICDKEYYRFDYNECRKCNCDMAGSVNKTCERTDGQCQCKPFVSGLKCSVCVEGSSNLDANNPYGCSKAPDQQPPPTYAHVSPTQLRIMWGPPDNKNGVIIKYALMRNDKEIYVSSINDTSQANTIVRSYLDTGLEPFTQYSYFVTAWNVNGSVSSPTVVVETLPGQPSGVFLLNLTRIMQTSASFEWAPPSKPNGYLIGYTLYGREQGKTVASSMLSTNDTTATVTNLVPFMNYTFVLEACTHGGCYNSTPTQGLTLGAAPVGQSAPNITAFNSTTLFLKWGPPTEPNGIIIFYELWKKDTATGTAELIFHPAGQYNPRPSTTDENALPPPATNYTVTGLKPFTEYHFQILSQNDNGKAASPWVTGRTGEALPFYMPIPTSIGIDSSSLQIIWTAPSIAQANGIILHFKLLEFVPNNKTIDPFGKDIIEKLIATVPANVTKYEVTGYKPYSVHKFKVDACNSVGCVSSADFTGQTFPSAPSAVMKPVATGYNYSTMQINWHPPSVLNGPDPYYLVERMTIPFSSPPPAVVPGTRFTGGGYYHFPRTVLPFDVSFTGIRMKFRTTAQNAALFYASTQQQDEFVVIQIRDGRVWFLFNPQGCNTEVEIDPAIDGNRTYSDGQWHSVQVYRKDFDGQLIVDDLKGCVTFISTTDDEGLPYSDNEWHDLFAYRDGKYGILRLDDLWTGTKNLSCTKGNLIGESTGVFVGGIPNTVELKQDAKDRRAQIIKDSFHGCIKDIQILQQESPVNVWRTLDWNLAIDRRQAMPAWEGCPGIMNISAVHFLGTGYLTIDVEAFSLTNKNFVLRWQIRTTLHSFFVLFMHGGDDRFLYLQVRQGAMEFTARGINTPSLESTSQIIQRTITWNNSAVNICDGYWHTLEIFKSGGQLRASVDGKHEVAEAYNYRVVARNAGGVSYSPWTSGRTKEGAPSGVFAPVSAISKTGYVVAVEWKPPVRKSGLLASYILKSYNKINTSIPAIETVFKNTEITKGDITNAIPATNYTITLTACTNGGCTESDQGIDVQTKTEAPEDVPAPRAIVGPTFMEVVWDKPGKPNGDIIGYFLYKDNVEEYAGTMQKKVLINLQVYTTYSLYVKACTVVGCTSGPKAPITTSQLPPAEMQPPVLQVLGTKSMRVDWKLPNQPNGVIQRYLIYASTNPSANGTALYNSTDVAFLFYELKTLIAGTNYFIRIAACTGGGCTISNASQARTEESAPEGVQAPNVTSPSPQELVVTWRVPTLPNGNVVRYELYHNGKLVYTNTRRYYQISNLQPWSVHQFYVKACTVKGCGTSPTTTVRTQESAPDGSVVLIALVKDARSVTASWNRPTTPNGFMNYNVTFEGFFYKDPATWDYSIITEKRVLLNTTEVGQNVVISGLIPYSTYSVQVVAYNTKGSIPSNVERLVMPEGTPDGVAPPNLVSVTSEVIQVTWTKVGRANSADQPLFQLQFKQKGATTPAVNLFNQPTTSNSYLKDKLDPYTEYEFRLGAKNKLGSTWSLWSSVYTKQDKPAILDPPRMKDVKQREITVFWLKPSKPNGIIEKYILEKNNSIYAQVESNTTLLIVTGLIPYTNYVFRVSACTGGGCTKSQDSDTVRTSSAAPEGIAAPTVSSQTPTSVLAVWTAPKLPNGILTKYTLQRRLKDSNKTVDIRHVTPNEAFTYLDQGSPLQPYTAYQYRVAVSTGIGTGYGPWATIFTRPSRPAGVLPPEAVVLSPHSLKIRWQIPLIPNGIIEMYVIKMPVPQIEVRNGSQTELIVENLVPYTTYSITIIACTFEGGCTESSTTNVRTSGKAPEGQPAPTAIPISQDYISIIWRPPISPNGPNIRYELSRMKVAQPLLASVTDLGIWKTVYTGTANSYEDRGLSLLTTNQYRLSVYNDFGFLNSAESSNVTTFGGQPTVPASLSIAPLSHVSIQLQWVVPGVKELQGYVEKFVVDIRSSHMNISKTYPGNATSSILTGLQPNTLYSCRISLTINGGASITGDWKTTSTLDGAPAGLSPPILRVLSENKIRVTWAAPTVPNGRITAYNILVDNRTILTNSTVPGSLVIDKLKPYTVYNIRIEVCTIFACVESNATKGVTLEDIAREIGSPNLSVRNSTAIEIAWTQPKRPNGIIKHYEIHRKTQIQCSKRPTPTALPMKKICTYIECGALESLCGTQCFTGTKTCCQDVLYDNKPNHECCGTAYIPKKSSPDDICCGGRFYKKIVNYQCCSDKYVEVLPGQICCPDLIQNRVDIGFGNRCCGSIPFQDNGAQICCSGQLHSRFGRQCCGKAIVDESLVCCGNSEKGVTFTKNFDNKCCGNEYITSNTTICCVDGGRAKSYTYLTADALLADNRKCCKTELISSGLSCCNSVGYNIASQVCADSKGCGDGTICPLSKKSQANCNRCDFNPSVNSCGSVSGNYIPGPTPSPTPPPTKCYIGPENVYSGRDFQFLDGNLSPYTPYEYVLVVVNGAGNGMSAYSSTRTAQSAPEGVLPPTAEVKNNQYDTIYLSWKIPLQPNGEISQYILLRGGLEIYRGAAMSYIDNNAIQPYKTYTYQLNACTVACTLSSMILVATLQAPPSGLSSPVVSNITSTSFSLAWQPPTIPNGVITHYLITRSDVGIIYNGTNLKLEVSGLMPYTSYSTSLEACSVAGCTKSFPSNILTSEALPLGFGTPRIVVLSSRSLELYWSPPEVPNGVITKYKVYQTSTTIGTQMIRQTLDHNITISGVVAGAQYQYFVEALNSAGGINSSIITVTLPSMTPEGISAPTNITVLSAYSLFVEWAPVAKPNGVIEQYKVLLNDGTTEIVKSFSGNSSNATIDGLKPYTEYELRIRACLPNINGCGTGPGTMIRMDEAAPLGLIPPTLQAQSATVIRVVWKKPSAPNGKITQYLINRRRFGDPIQLTINLVKGDVFSYVNTDVTLLPFTDYEYQVVAFNSKGSMKSAWARIRTLQTIPQEVNAPRITESSAYGFKLDWASPTKPNGIIVKFIIQYQEIFMDPTQKAAIRNISVASTTNATSFSGLNPFSEYRVRLIAVNSAGEGISFWASGKTGETAPADIAIMIVIKNPSGTSLNLKWQVPGKPNGNIKQYKIYEVGTTTPIYTGLTQEFEYRRLTPFTEYTIQLEACNTLTGNLCGKGGPQKVITAEILPNTPVAPAFGKVNATHVEIQWTRPSKLNGKILEYKVLRQASPVTNRKKRSLSQPQIVYRTKDTSKANNQFVDKTVKPYTNYKYQIQTCNSVGCVSSPVQSVQTPQAPPSSVSKPTVQHIKGHPDKLNITWTVPTEPNGIIQDYKLQQNTSVPLSFGAQDPKVYQDTGLIAYTKYSYTISVCTQGGCTKSSPTHITTMETPPLLVTPPTIVTMSSTNLKAHWVKPQITNGQIIAYHLYMNNANVYSGMTMDFTLTNLIPFRAYTFILSACTNGGCKNSTSVVGRPDEAAPQRMKKPKLQVTSSVSIEITWTLPLDPNGIITSFELRRNGTIIQKTNGFRYTDYGLTPGKIYAYTVTVYNSKGNVTSAASTATTYSSSPEGILPPQLTPLSSESIKATWSKPAQPNGKILNYTLLIDDKSVYTGNKMTYTVLGLAFFTEFRFYVRVCTSAGCTSSGENKARTKEASPSDVQKPTLVPLENINGMHNGVRVQWRYPGKPNGNITKYELFRRKIEASGPASGTTYGPELKIYSGLPLNLEFEDKDSVLKPFTDYQYRLVAFNKVGQSSSGWQTVRTQEAPPARVDKLTILGVTATSIKTEVPIPDQPNGIIQTYEIVVDRLGLAKSENTTITVRNLNPYQNYSIQARVCTSVGCTNSPPVLVQTKSAPPSGLSSVVVLETTITSALISWSAPSRPNGVITSYELSYRLTCLKTSSGACTHGATYVATRGLVLRHNITNLQTYSNYSFAIQVYNEVGRSEKSAWVDAMTKPSAPVILNPPVMTTNGSFVIVNWKNSFILNGELLEYLLYTDNQLTYSGTATSAFVERSTRNQKFRFMVRCRTRQGIADTKSVVFDPQSPGNIGSTVAPQPPLARSMPFYQEVWFIAFVLIVALVLLFIGIVFCIKYTGRSTPFIRERAPLQPRQAMSNVKPGYMREQYEDSYVADNHRPDSQASIISAGKLHPGYVNPAFATVRSSRPNSVHDLTFDHRSQKSSKYMSDDEDDLIWSGQVPYDSGIHNLTFNASEDYGPSENQPYSIATKEQLFTDTHL